MISRRIICKKNHSKILNNEEVTIVWTCYWKGWLLQLIFSHLDHWLSKLTMRGLKLGTNILENTWRTINTIWNFWNSILIKKYQTLVVDSMPRKRICLIKPWAILSIWETLGEHLEWKMGGKILGYNTSLYQSIPSIA